jgi:2-polyprenyl-3-methyl-5-hydroxy-6-metoxy-1,4-benzoquinol methylase
MHHNQHPHIILDIPKLHQQIDQDRHIKTSLPLKKSWLKLSIEKILIKYGFYERFVEMGIIRDWFDDFQDYWKNVLKQRPILFFEFFFLYAWFRIQFQDINLSKNIKSKQFLDTWQHSDTIYLLFFNVLKVAKQPLIYLNIKKYIHDNDKVLEYGCGAAPYTHSFIRAGHKKLNFTLADIPQITFHYAKWRLKQNGVKFVNLDPNRVPNLATNYDIIILTTVLEHLPQPLKIIKYLTQHLKPEGYLIFDYVLSKATGLDTANGLKQRTQVLKFIKTRYRIITGKIFYDKSTPLTVARKK